MYLVDKSYSYVPNLTIAKILAATYKGYEVGCLAKESKAEAFAIQFKLTEPSSITSVTVHFEVRESNTIKDTIELDVWINLKVVPYAHAHPLLEQIMNVIEGRDND